MHLQAVSLGELPLGASEVTNLAGVDDGDREARRPECGGDGRLVAPGGFHDDALGAHGLETEDQCLQNASPA